MAGQVVGNQVQVAVGIGVVKRLQQAQIARGVARGRRLGQHLPSAHAQRPVDPGLLAHIPHPDSALFGNIGISHKSWHDEALQQPTEHIPRLPVPWYVVTNGINSTRFMRK